MTEPVIRTSELSMAFGGHLAVNRVSVDFQPRRLTSIIGPNGAGKTTLLNLISGQLKPAGGAVYYKGENITFMPPHRRVQLGIGRSFQLTNLFPKLTVLENVRLAVQAREKVGYKIFTHYGRLRAVTEEAARLLAQVNLEHQAAAAAASLPHGEKRKLELALILALKPEVLLLDEPTAGMAVEEVPAILELLAQIKTEGTRTIILVEHKIDIVLSLSDEIVVLQNGRLLARGEPEGIIRNRQVQEAYLGGAV